MLLRLHKQSMSSVLYQTLSVKTFTTHYTKTNFLTIIYFSATNLVGEIAFLFSNVLNLGCDVVTASRRQ